ncbi:MAG: hypothetical protein RL885_08110 [Planctomycetota bacterium]
MNRLFSGWMIAALLVAPLAAQTTPIEKHRQAALEIAESYATYEWQAGEQNRFHGKDERGVQVDTPDADFVSTGWKPGKTYRGVPYQWGGFSSLEQFQQGIDQGLWAGHLPNRKSNPGTSQAVGVDCSGFVARCWRLAEKQSTRSLGNLCYRLESWDELAAGDAINRFDAHVMLFKEWVGEDRQRVRVYEAVTPCVLEREHDVADLEKQGYVPLRYRPFDPRWYEGGVDFEEPTFIRGDRDVEWTASGEAKDVTADLLREVLSAARPGDWVRYRLGSGAEAFSISRGLPEKSEELRTRTDRGENRIESVEPFEANGSLLEAWLRRMAPQGVVKDLEIQKLSGVSGEVKFADERFAAERVSGTMTLSMPSGSTSIPIRVELEGLWSKAVPIDGFFELDLKFHVLDEKGAVTQTVDQHYELEAMRGGSEPDRVP